MTTLPKTGDIVMVLTLNDEWIKRTVHSVDGEFVICFSEHGPKQLTPWIDWKLIP